MLWRDARLRGYLGFAFRSKSGASVVVARVLVEVTGKQWQTTVTQRRRIYSGGAKSMASAAQLDLQRGEQSFDFVLPTELQPVLTQFELIGAQAGTSPMLTGYLYGGHAIGDASEQLLLQLDGFQLWSLPGQTLQLQLYIYRLLAGQGTTWMLRPMTSATEVVHVQPMVQK